MKKGFTLIELLVVIGIIAILAAILFPVFAKVRGKARETQCLSNMKQIGLAAIAYINDYGHAFPSIDINAPFGANYYVGFERGTGGTTKEVVNERKKYTYRWQLEQYVKNEEVFCCPSDKGEIDDWGIVSSSWEVGKRYTSYTYKYYIGCRTSREAVFTNVDDDVIGSGPSDGRPYYENDFDKPSQTVIFMETIPYHDKNREGIPSDAEQANYWNTNAKMNFTFIDGHTKSYPTIQALPCNEIDGSINHSFPRIADPIAYCVFTGIQDIN